MAKIYLDHAATTPVDKKVLDAMLPYFSEKFGNAMSIHSFGKVAEEAIDEAREILAKFFHCQTSEIIFTSGATESNNLVLKGVVKSYWSKFNKKPHIITTAFEHHCVLDTCKSLEKENLAEVSYIKPDKEGIISVENIKKAIQPNTILVSIMYVNNEIGTLQPIQKIGDILKAKNQPGLPAGRKLKTKILFHTDATQAMNYFDCDVQKLGVDLLSLSGHKIYGPKGIGALYIKKGTPIKKIQDGGDQEFHMRAGTQNVPGIAGLAAAIQLVKNSKLKVQRILKLRNYLIEKVLREIPDAKLNGSKKFRSPNNANFTFKNVEGEGLLLSLDMEGIACSTGSACSIGSLESSHVLLSLGMKPEEAHGSLRVTLGKHTTRKEIDIFVKKLKKTISRLRKISGKVLQEFYSNK